VSPHHFPLFLTFIKRGGPAEMFDKPLFKTSIQRNYKNKIVLRSTKMKERGFRYDQWI